MKFEKKNISKNRIKLIISVSAKKMEEYFESEYLKLKDTVEVPGFRKGTAPKLMAIEAIGHGKLSRLALEKAIDDSFKAGLADQKVRPVTTPSISISKHPSFVEGSKDGELQYEVEFDILPEAKIGNYKKIKVKKQDPKSISVTDEEVDKVVGYLRRQAADLKNVERKIKKGDWVEINFEGSIDNVKKDKLSSESMPIVIGETKLIPGFEENIIGMKKGEDKEFDIDMPKDFSDKEFAGKKIHFKVSVKGVKEINLPKIDKKFLESFGLKSEKELRNNIKKGLTEEKRENQRKEIVADISEQIIKITKVDIPESMVKGEVDRMREVLKNDLMRQGLTIDKYLERLKLKEDKFEEDLKKQAEKNIRLGVGLAEIAKKEDLEISQEKGTNAVFDFLIENAAK